MRNSKKLGKPIAALSTFLTIGGYGGRKTEYTTVYRAPTKKITAVEQEKPSLFGKKLYTYEHKIYKEFIASAPQEFQGLSTFDNLTKMRHYSVPNRLLDVTFDPFVALFFAVWDKKSSNAFIFYKVKNDNIKYYDSDTVLILSALTKLKYNDKLILKTIVNLFKSAKKNTYDFNDIKELNTELKKLVENKAYGNKVKFKHKLNDDVKKFEKEQSGENKFDKQNIFNLYVSHFVGQLDWEIRKEQPSWYPKMLDLETFTQCYLVKPKMNNPRIIAQSGAFFIFPFDDTDIKTALYANDARLHKITDRAKIKKQMEYINISAGKYMPDLDTYARQLIDGCKNKHTVKKT